LELFAKIAEKNAEKKIIGRLMQNSKLWNAGMFDASNSDWMGTLLSPNQELRQNLKVLKQRARYLYQNTPVVFSAVRKAQQFVKPITLASKVTTSRNGFNIKANKTIEESWADFCKMGNFEVSGKFSLNDCIDQMLIQLFVDGEILLRKVMGRGKYGFQIQLLNTDQLVIETHNSLSGPYQMSIEYDEFDKPTKYFILNKLPTEGGSMGTGATGATPIPFAPEEIIHAYLPHAVKAGRGVPLIAASMSKIEALDSYDNAVAVAAKMAACTSVTYEQLGLDDEPYEGAAAQGPAMLPGVSQTGLTPGMAEALPPGVKKVLLTPNQPTQSYSEYTKSGKKDISTGIGWSYNTLYSDIEDPSFSGMKSAHTQDRTFIGEIQRFLVEKVLDVIFSDFIDNACALGKIKLPAGPDGYESYKAHAFVGAGYPFIDRLKDTQADIADLDAGLSTFSDILAARGKDFEEHCQTRQKDNLILEQYGLSITNQIPTNNPAMGKPGATPNTDEMVETEGKPSPKEPLEK